MSFFAKELAMKKRSRWWYALPPGLALLGGAGAVLGPRSAGAVEREQLTETFTVSPSGLETIVTFNGRGDIDNRPVDATAPKGLMWLGPNDMLHVNVTAPADLNGKSGSCQINYQIREEYNEDCEKKIVHHP